MAAATIATHTTWLSGPPAGAIPFSVNAYNTDWSAGEVVVAAVASKRHYLQFLQVVNHTAGTTYWFGDTEAPAGTVDPAILGVYTGGSITVTFDRPVAFGSGLPIIMDASAGTTIVVVAQGFTY